MVQLKSVLWRFKKKFWTRLKNKEEQILISISFGLKIKHIVEVIDESEFKNYKYDGNKTLIIIIWVMGISSWEIIGSLYKENKE